MISDVIQELAKRLIEQSLRLGRQKATSLGMRLRNWHFHGGTIHQWGEGRRGSESRCDMGRDRSMGTQSSAFGATDFSRQNHAVCMSTVIRHNSSIQMMMMVTMQWWGLGTRMCDRGQGGLGEVVHVGVAALQRILLLHLLLPLHTGIHDHRGLSKAHQRHRRTFTHLRDLKFLGLLRLA